MLDKQPTDDQKAALVTSLHRMSQMFRRGADMEGKELAEYLRTLTHYRGTEWAFTVQDLDRAILLAREGWDVAGMIPTPRFIMDRIKPYRQG